MSGMKQEDWIMSKAQYESQIKSLQKQVQQNKAV